MGNPKLTVAEIQARGNPSQLSKRELKERAAEEKAKTPNIRGSRPRMPAHLSPEAVIAWKDAVRILKKRGTLSAGDAPTLEVYAEKRARWIAAKKDLAERGIQVEVVVLDKDRNPVTRTVTNPNLKVAENCEKELLALAKALGMTPIDREKVKRVSPVKPTRAEMFPPGSFGAKYPHLVPDNLKGVN